MFVDPNELIEIKVFYKKIGRHYVVTPESEYLLLDDEDKAKYKCLTARVRELTWGLYNDLNEDSVMKDMSGNRQWNYKLYKENKLRKILVAWDAKRTKENGESVPIPVNEESIKNLVPDIAEYILSTYDTIMFVSEDEEKK
jgi:hypothetical protein